MENSMVMEKRIYATPLVEVEKISLSQCLLAGSPVAPVPPHPGAPARRAPGYPTYGSRNVVPVF